MDFEPNTVVFPVVITGIVVLPNGQVTVVTPNGTFLADTTLVPRPVLKPTVLEDKNGNQFIVHPDGTVTSLGQAGLIPKPMTMEEKLDKIRRGLYLEALKDYKTQIESYYTANNIAIPTRGPRNHNKNIIIDLPECIGTEANEIKSNFLAINDNVNKKELRENSLKRILGTSKKTTLDALAQTALANLSTKVKITETEFKQFLSTLQFKTEKDSVCGEWRGTSINPNWLAKTGVFIIDGTWKEDGGINYTLDMNYTGNSIFLKKIITNLNLMATSVNGRKLLGILINSEYVVYITNTHKSGYMSFESGGGMRKQEPSTGGMFGSIKENSRGGIFHAHKIVEINTSGNPTHLEAVAHELYHAYYWNKMYQYYERGVFGFINTEVEAYLFGRAISIKVEGYRTHAFSFGKKDSSGAFFDTFSCEPYDVNMEYLLRYSFNESKYDICLGKFMLGAANNSHGAYYNSTYVNKNGTYRILNAYSVINGVVEYPPIKNFYPLIQ